VGWRRPTGVDTTLPKSWALAGLAVALVASLGGCGGAGAKPDDISASVMPTSSVTSARQSALAAPARTGPLTTGPGVLPGEKPPVEPDLARVHSDAGAYAFTIYFMRALSWSIATNDTWLLELSSAQSCAACARYIAGIQALRAKGEAQIGGRPVISKSQALAGSYPAGAEFAVEYTFDESATTMLPSNKHLPSNRGVRSIVYVAWTGRGWQVVKQAAP
jgi:uncharacterized protein DUF6318